MAFFVKLFSGIVQSTVWREDLHVKVVWITLLALSDWNGIVCASVPGLASAAGVSVDQCREALERLCAPDEDSRTKEYEGRRIEPVDGGWFILNYVKYREMRDEERRKEQVRQAVARHRERKKADVSNGHQSKPLKAHKEASKEAVRTTVPSLRSGDDVVPPVVVAVEAPFQAPASPLVAQVVAWSREACDDWIARFGGTAPGGQIGKAMKPLVDRHGWAAVRAAWQSYLGQTEAEYASPTRFASTFGRWSGGEAPPAGKSSVAQRTIANLQGWVAGKEGGK